MRVYYIKKGDAIFIGIPEETSYDSIRQALGTKELISGFTRNIGYFRFRVYCKDTVSKPTFYSAMNQDGTPDVPEESIIILSEPNDGEEIYLDINSIVETILLNNTFIYKASEDNQEQPILKWIKEI